jgi:hypothetical protein
VTDTNVFHMARHPRLLQQNRHKADISRLSPNVRFLGVKRTSRQLFHHIVGSNQQRQRELGQLERTLRLLFDAVEFTSLSPLVSHDVFAIECIPPIKS